MRKINKDFDDAPKILQDCARKNEGKLLENEIISSDCYKKSRAKLEEQFNEKCAYCETKYKSTSDTWIEHYRPKSEYYWLAYEWSNLIPTCTKCNRKKNNYFPLIDETNRVKKPPLSNGQLDTSACKADAAILLNEHAFVLHPKIDNPEEYLDFQIDENCEGIKIIGIDDIEHDMYEGRGDATIEICDLNRRDLKIDRYKKVVEEIVDIFNNTLKMLQMSNVPLTAYEKMFSIHFDKIKQNAERPELEYTLLRKVIIDKKKFIEIICQSIEDEIVRAFVEKTCRVYL